MYDANFSIRTNEPMLAFGARPGTNSLFRCPKYSLAIVGVEHFADCRYIH
jgi:hypothetical protein